MELSFDPLPFPFRQERSRSDKNMFEVGGWFDIGVYPDSFLWGDRGGGLDKVNFVYLSRANLISKVVLAV